MYLERKLRPNKMETEDVVFCWLRFHCNSRFHIPVSGDDLQVTPTLYEK